MYRVNQFFGPVSTPPSGYNDWWRGDGLRQGPADLEPTKGNELSLPFRDCSKGNQTLQQKGQKSVSQEEIAKRDAAIEESGLWR